MKQGKFSIMTMILAVIFLTVGCSQGKKSEQESKNDQEEVHEHSHGGDDQEHPAGGEENHEHPAEESGHQHGGGDMDMSSGADKSWTPGSEADYKITKDFHFVTGSMDNINPEVVQDAEGNPVLQLTADGTPATFVFHQTFGNVGMSAMVNVSELNGTFKLVHHTKSNDTYEFVSITGGNMKLGRVVEGQEQVFDEGTFSADAGWINLRLSAAGTHFKGYIGNETVTHGHGDKMPDGYVGVMVDGTGKVQIKSIELVTLEDE